MSTTIYSDNQGLLDYAITTSPKPISVSPKEGPPSLLSLCVTVSNNTNDPIYCDKVIFTIPISDLAQSLASTADGIVCQAEADTDWKISESGPGEYTATPKRKRDQKITTKGLVFQFYHIQVNKQPGTFTLWITENSSTDNKTFSNRDNAFNLAKFPYGFYLDGFTASAPQVEDKGTVTLSWNGSEIADYFIHFQDQKVNVSEVRSWTSPMLDETTTFALQALYQGLGENIDTYMYLTVIVNKPDLTCTSLAVDKGAKIEGSLAVKHEISGVGITPPGGIIIYGGRIETFDENGKGKLGTKTEGWQICNGENGAPDLRDRFIVGAGSSYNSGSTGGDKEVTLTEKQLPPHRHTDESSAPIYVNTNGETYKLVYSKFSYKDTDSGRNVACFQNVTSSKTDYIQAEVSHASAGGGNAFDNRPPYYALYYIMKMPKNNLKPTEYLAPGERLVSANGQYEMVFQGDGNLVIYTIDSGDIIHSFGTNCDNPVKAVMQSDGYFVVYRKDANKEKSVDFSNPKEGALGVWAEGSNPTLTLKDDGTVEIINSKGIETYPAT
ncbi:hypothetical protein [Thalassotalea fusca]